LIATEYGEPSRNNAGRDVIVYPNGLILERKIHSKDYILTNNIDRAKRILVTRERAKTAPKKSKNTPYHKKLKEIRDFMDLCRSVIYAGSNYVSRNTYGHVWFKANDKDDALYNLPFALSLLLNSLKYPSSVFESPYLNVYKNLRVLLQTFLAYNELPMNVKKPDISFIKKHKKLIIKECKEWSPKYYKKHTLPEMFSICVYNIWARQESWNEVSSKFDLSYSQLYKLVKQYKTWKRVKDIKKRVMAVLKPYLGLLKAKNIKIGKAWR
jgi:hypothetical protein